MIDVFHRAFRYGRRAVRRFWDFAAYVAGDPPLQTRPDGTVYVMCPNGCVSNAVGFDRYASDCENCWKSRTCPLLAEDGRKELPDP